MRHHDPASIYSFMHLFVYIFMNYHSLSPFLTCLLVCFFSPDPSESAVFVTLFSLCKWPIHSQHSFLFLLPDIRWFIGVPLISLGFKTVKQPVYVSTLHKRLAMGVSSIQLQFNFLISFSSSDFVFSLAYLFQLVASVYLRGACLQLSIHLRMLN